MKKVTVIVVICLVMCFSMAFSASAAVTVNQPDWAYFLDAVIEKALSECPAGYNYAAYYINEYQPPNAAWFDGPRYGVRVFYYNSPEIPANVYTTFYHAFYYVNYSNRTHTSLSITTVTAPTKITGTFTLSVSGNYFVVKYPGFASTSLYYLSDRSTAKFYNQDTYMPTVAWYVTLDSPLPDISALTALITTAKQKQNTGYTGTTWQALQTAITTAENLLNTTGYTQEQIDTARNNLQSALDGLTMLPSTTELRALLVEADAITDIGYTLPTWNRFTTARSNGHALIASTNYTAPQVTATTTELRDSMNGLALYETPVTPPVQPPVSYDYDLGDGNIAGLLAVVPGIIFNYVLSVAPIASGIFAIIISIKIVPHIFSIVISRLRR